MQTKKKNLGRNAGRGPASQMVTRMQKKVSTNVQLPEKKVTELITSSARKQKPVGTSSKKSGNAAAATKMKPRYGLAEDENDTTCIENEVTDVSSMGDKDDNEGHASGTIFSPSFHKSKTADGEAVSGDEKYHQDCLVDCSEANTLTKHVFQDNEHRYYGGNEYHSVNPSWTDDMDVDTTATGDHLNVHQSDEYSLSSGVHLSSEVSAIYLAMKNSKLECAEEHGQESISTDVYEEAEDCDDFDEFDPYLFIKNLPDLSYVVPTFRRTLLPKQTRSCPRTTLVLDLDETLVHSSLEPCGDADFTFPVKFNLQEHAVYVRCRPHLKDFMERVSRLFEIIIFTASQSIYADQLLNVLDPKRKIFRHRVFRDSCLYVNGNYLKDLSILGRDLARVIIIDNSPQAFGFQVDNGIPIESWFDDRSDQELLLLLPFLESLVEVEDVRPLIARKFNLKERIAAASYPMNSARGISY